jgi:hypothetical protein
VIDMKFIERLSGMSAVETEELSMAEAAGYVQK